MDGLKKKVTKKVISLLLIVTMLVGTVSMSSIASDTDGTSTDTATVTDLYNIIGDTEKVSPSETLGTLSGTENVGWKMKVDLSNATANDILIGLANDSTNFWNSTGYAADINISNGRIKLFAKTELDSSKGKTQVASSEWIAGLKTAPFELEMGVVNQYNEGSSEVVARKVYIKKDGVEVVSYIDSRTDHVLGNNICLSGLTNVKLSSSDYKKKDIEVYDYFEITKKLEDTKLTGTQTIGNLPQTSNVGYKMKVDMTQATTNPTDLFIGLSNTAWKSGGNWVFDGYRLLIGKNKMELQPMVGSTASGNINKTVTGVHSAAFELEMGVQDIVQTSDETLVARMVYVKKDGTEVIKYLDTNLTRPMGNYIRTLYAADDIVGTVDYADCAVHDVTVYDFYKVTGVSSKTVDTVLLGALPRSTNVGWKMKTDLSTLKGERLIGLSNSAVDFWNSTGYAIDVNANSNKISIFAQVDDDAAGKANVVSASCSGLASQFELEFGVADVYRTTTNEVVARRVYAKKDGVEVVSYVDWDVNLVLGTSIYQTNSNGITVDSVEHSEEVPVAQLQKTPTVCADLYDLTDKYVMHMNAGQTDHLGTVGTSFNSIKTKVKLDEVNDNSSQFLITIGSTDDKIAIPVDGSGYQVWFQPNQDKIVIQHGVEATGADATQGTVQQVAWNNAVEIPDEFTLEIGLRHILFNNNSVYGVEIYVMIDDTQVLNWVDLDEDRVLGTNVLCYTTSTIDVDFYSLLENYAELLIGDATKVIQRSVVVVDGAELPTGWIEDKYVINWSYNGSIVTQFDMSNAITEYVANYIDKKMLEVKVQTKQEDNSITARFIGSLDDYQDTDYECVGFVLSTTTKDPLLASNNLTKDIYKVWDAIYVSGTLKGASELYDAYSQQLFAFDVAGLPNGKTVYARAFVKLADGTMVYGDAATKVISVE